MTPNVNTAADMMYTSEQTTIPGNQSPPPTYDHERSHADDDKNNSWNVLYQQPVEGMNTTSRVEYRTRLEPLSQALPNSLYAPIIYQMHVTFKMKPIANTNTDKWNDLEFIIAKLRVVNGQQPHEEILKNGKPIIQGTQQVALTRQKTQNGEYVYFGHNKIQFLDCSYHHNKQSFALEWSFFFPNDLSRPLLILLSSAFKVYARKPNKKRKDVENVDADMQHENEQKQLKRKRGMNEKYYEFHLTKNGQQDGRANMMIVDVVNETRQEESSPVVASFIPIEGQPLKKRARMSDDGARVTSPQRDSPMTVENEKNMENNGVLNTVNDAPKEGPQEEDGEFQERLGKLLDYVKSHKNMTCVQVVISSMMAVASDMYREAGAQMN